MNRTVAEVDPDRLAGREYEITLSYTVDYHITVTASPEEWQAVEETELVASPAGPVDATDWDLIHEDVTAVCNIWMDDPEAPNAADWLEEPHVPSNETDWDDSPLFGDESNAGK
jgi:hypothetical protein